MIASTSHLKEIDVNLFHGRHLEGSEVGIMDVFLKLYSASVTPTKSVSGI